MKNKIWCRVKSFCMAALLAGGSMAGNGGGTVLAAAEDTNDTKIILEEEARWTDPENYRARITVKIKGFQSWFEKQKEEEEGQDQDPENPSDPEENEPGGQEAEEPSPEETGKEEESEEQKREETEPGTEDTEENAGEEGSAGEENTEEEISEGENYPGTDTRTEEADGEETESFEEEDSSEGETQEQISQEGADGDKRSGEDPYEEEVSGENCFGTEEDAAGQSSDRVAFSDRAKRKQVMVSIQMHQEQEEIRELDFAGTDMEGGTQEENTQEENTQEENTQEEGARKEEFYLVHLLSPYFEPDEEALGEDMSVEEVSVQDMEGEDIPLKAVHIPLDPLSMQEDSFTAEIPLILQEPYRLPERTCVYPTGYSRSTELDAAEDAVHLFWKKGEEAFALSSTSAPSLQADALRGSFLLELLETGGQPVAGQSFRYEVSLKNTGCAKLKNIRLTGSFSPENIGGVWEEAQGLRTDSRKAVLDTLDVGETRTLAFTGELDEAFQGKLSFSVTASAADPGEPSVILKQNASAQHRVEPLKVDFSVVKSANRVKAAPGDVITYQICIRNTGERTLHSVLSTERFLEENIPARFLEQEGVLLNDERTQALIPRILPGEVFSMEAVVALPEDLQKGELINQVSVTSKETGTKEVRAQSSVEVEPPQTGVDFVEMDLGENGGSAVSSSSPQTGDVADPLGWAQAMGTALFVIFVILFRGKWLGKEKTKH